MIDEHIEKIESAVRGGNISEQKKRELLDLLPKLKAAMAEVSATHDERAQAIARKLVASADEAMRSETQSDAAGTSAHGLKESVEEFEASHPQLVAVVNEFATVLSSMGV
jgi:hypothetical protein